MATKLKMPVKTVRLDFDEDGYPGFLADARINLPIGLSRRIVELGADDDENEARALLLKLFTWWNFADDDGQPIPHSVDGFEAIPNELLLAMYRRRAQALQEAVMPGPLGTASSPENNGASEGS